uniref:Uncharacterized protein n=1 Tax=Tanacetum cinerariifolium TaxID=118510 RepID=A0A699GHW7_TANCI|nr:hypothetical protein [Tanacetum cinerariifolium]
MNEPNNPITPNPITLPTSPPQPDTPPSHSSTPILPLTQTQPYAQTVDSHTPIPINNSSQTTPNHPMVTRTKAGIFKPLKRMNFHVTTTLPLLRSHVHALRDPNWKEAMLDEYNALITSRTQRIISSLHSEFAMMDLGSLNYFLGIFAQRSTSGLFLSQSKFVEEIIEQAYMQNCNPCQTLVDTKSKLGSDDNHKVCLYMHDPRDPYFTALKRIFFYVRGTLDYGLQLRVSSTTQLSAYTDVDWAILPVTRQSTSRYCVFLGDNLLSWSMKRQVILSRSSAEAKYRGVANVVAETAWIYNLLCEVHTPLFTPTLVYCDNEYLLEFTSEYGISKALHPELPGPEDRIVCFPKGKHEAREKYPAMVYQALRFPKKLEQSLLLGGREGVPNYCGLAYDCSEGRNVGREYVFLSGCDNTEHTPYPNPKTTRGTTLLNRVEPQILPGRRDIDLFSLIRAPNPTKVKTGRRPRAAHEVPMLTVTANRVIEIEDPVTTTDSSRVPSTIERSPLDFAHKEPSQQLPRPKDQKATIPEVPPPKNVPNMGFAPEAGQAERVAATSPLVVKVHRKRGHDGVDTNAPPKVLRRDHADPLTNIEYPPREVPCCHRVRNGIYLRSSCVTRSSKGAAAAEDPDSENTSFASMVGSLESIYRPEWGITNGSMIDTPKACQDLLRLRFEQEAKLLKKFVAQVANQNKRIQASENKIKNLETLLEAEADMEKAVENKTAELCKELENIRTMFLDLQYEDNWVEQRCAEIDACLDALSIDFDEELYLHMLIAIACCTWMIGCGLCLAVMKCGESTELRQAFADVVSKGIAKGMSEGLKHRVEHGKAKLDLEAIEAYDPKVEAKYITALHALKNLNGSVNSVLVLPSSRSLCTWRCMTLWTPGLTRKKYCYRMLLRPTLVMQKRKKCRVACRTHGVSFAHHARSDGVSVSVPTVAPQGLAILLANAATQTETSDEASPRLLRLSSLPVIHG